MYLPDFEYYAPGNLSEACGLLVKYGNRAKLLAGGTDILIKMKHHLIEPEVLISLKGISELTGIRYEQGKGVIIGARTTHNGVVNSPLLQQKYLSVCEAAHHMANNQVRNTGTVGGNIVNAVPSADLPPIFIALGASVKLVGANSERELPLEDFFTGPNRSVIAGDEIMTEIIIPDQPTTGSTYMKFGLRRSGALAVVGVAASVVLEGDVLKDVRIVLGAVAPIPMRAVNTENTVRGQKVSEELFEQAGQAAAQECKPIQDIRGSVEYRRDLVRVFTRRSLLRAANEGHV